MHSKSDFVEKAKGTARLRFCVLLIHIMRIVLFYRYDCATAMDRWRTCNFALFYCYMVSAMRLIEPNRINIFAFKTLKIHFRWNTAVPERTEYLIS